MNQLIDFVEILFGRWENRVGDRTVRLPPCVENLVTWMTQEAGCGSPSIPNATMHCSLCIARNDEFEAIEIEPRVAARFGGFAAISAASPTGVQ